MKYYKGLLNRQYVRRFIKKEFNKDIKGQKLTDFLNVIEPRFSKYVDDVIDSVITKMKEELKK